jgi:hypothetical protein
MRARIGDPVERIAYAMIHGCRRRGLRSPMPIVFLLIRQAIPSARQAGYT